MNYQMVYNERGERLWLPLIASAAIISAPLWHNNKNDKCCSGTYPYPVPYPAPPYPYPYYYPYPSTPYPATPYPNPNYANPAYPNYYPGQTDTTINLY